ncbi:hypothetical protein [Nocardia asiatica]|uniref:hypothetical protein n=1 Tax=Nocardia asiatica TaxID=209252 RepID=UPI0005C1AE5C|nr:hypothetical protein [Nocardia asiatica]
MPALAAGPPTEPELVPRQVAEPLAQIFTWFLWFGALLSLAGFISTVMILVWQRRSSASTQLLEEATLIRILIAAAALGSAATAANRLLE